MSLPSIKHQLQLIKNQSSWDKAGEIFKKTDYNNLEKKFKSSSFLSLSKHQILTLKSIGVKKKTIAHLGCNNGRELISLERMGASECIGFDFSKEFIYQAKKLNKACGGNCEFTKINILDISKKYYNRFDMVIITPGTLVWFKNLIDLFTIAQKMLRKNGIIFIDEIHPVLFMLNKSKTNNELKITNSYFFKKTIKDTEALYYLGNKYRKLGTQYLYQYTMSDVIGSLIKSRFIIKKFGESNSDVSEAFKRYENKVNFPMNFHIIAQKT